MVNKLLTEYPIEKLVPEAWFGRSQADSEALASAIVALRLVRRGFPAAALEWLQRVVAAQSHGELEPAVVAVARMAAGDHEGAASALASCRSDDPVALNLDGELLARRGQLEKAADRFRRALALAPGYGEAVANLVGLGGRLGLNLVNTDWRRFAV
jgi:Flp pilus assembly protein TadD